MALSFEEQNKAVERLSKYYNMKLKEIDKHIESGKPLIAIAKMMRLKLEIEK